MTSRAVKIRPYAGVDIVNLRSTLLVCGRVERSLALQAGAYTRSLFSST
jgi:hypothetical protein